MTTGSMSLKATAKEFIPSFNVAKSPSQPHLPPQTAGGVAPIPNTATTPSSFAPAERSSPLLLNQIHQQHSNTSKKDSSIHTKPKQQKQQKQQNRGPPRQESGQHHNHNHQNEGEQGNHQKSDQILLQKREHPQQRNNGPSKSRHSHPQQPQQSLTAGSGQQSGNHGGNNNDLHNSTQNNNSRRNKNATAQTVRPLNKTQDQNRSNTSTTTTPGSSSSVHGSGKHQHQQQRDNAAATAASNGGKPPQGRSGSFSKTSAQISNTSTTTAKTRKGSIDHANQGSNISSSANGSASAGGSSSAAAAAGSSSSTSTITTGSSSSNIIPGMEATAFICLTDVILPVRQVVKDGVSTMAQGSDAYLDWIVRSLKEHEEITLIGMEAAIPDIIALVLRAGLQGIGYQEIRTFTTQDGFGGNKSCLQFRMRRGQGYIPLEKRPPRS